jgi:hypothetical protein
MVYFSSSADSSWEFYAEPIEMFGLRVSMMGMLESCMSGDLGEGERGDLNV